VGCEFRGKRGASEFMKRDLWGKKRGAMKEIEIGKGVWD